MQTVWQARMEPYDGDKCPPCNWKARGEKPRLKAWAEPSEAQEDLCEIPEAGGYRGIDNRLYRVEVHEGGDPGSATFKWSRDNGAVVYLVEAVQNGGKEVVLAEQPKDRTLALQAGDWLEVQWEERALSGKPGILKKVAEITDEAGRTVELESTLSPSTDLTTVTDLKVRRWDHRENGQSLSEGAIELQEDADLALEDGIYVRFENDAGTYDPGDYWTIPARSILEDVLWPTASGDRTGGTGDTALYRGPEGIDHHYCPLGLVDVEPGDDSDEENVTYRVIRDCRRAFPRLTEIEKTCCRAVEPEDDLRQAIDEVTDAGGGCISLCRGVHTVEAPLALRHAQNLTIHGEGKATILYLKDESENAGAGILLEGCRTVQLKNMVVVGEGVGTVIAAADAVEFGESHDLTFDELSVVHRALVPPYGEDEPGGTIEDDIGMRPGYEAYQPRTSVAMFAEELRETSVLTASAIRLENISEVTISGSHLLAPIGVEAPWGRDLPEPPEAAEEPPTEDERTTIDFEDLTLETTYQIDDQLSSGRAAFQVSDSAVFAQNTLAVVAERSGRQGVLCQGIRIDIDFEESFGAPAAGLQIRAVNQSRTHELRVNGESEFVVEGSVIDFDGMTIGGVDVSAREATGDLPGQVLSFSGSVRTLGIGGEHLFVDDMAFGVGSEPEESDPVFLNYGEGAQNVEIIDCEVHFSRYGVLSCRSEAWSVRGSRFVQLTPAALDGQHPLPDTFDTLDDAGPLYDLLDMLPDQTSGELPRAGAAIKSFIWRDSDVEDCELHASNGFDGWFQVRGRLADCIVRTQRRGLNAVWLHDADWRNNTVTASGGASLLLGGSLRGRIAKNRTEADIGLVNLSVAQLVRDLYRLVLSIERMYRLRNTQANGVLVVWILLEETVRIMGFRTLVERLEQQIQSALGQVNADPEPGSTHADLERYPLLYVAAKYLVSWLQKQTGVRDLQRPLPLVNVEVTRNRMESTGDGIRLEGFFTAGGIEISENQIHAGQSGRSGQTIRLNASPYSVNVHLINTVAEMAVSAVNDAMDDAKSSGAAESLQLTADNRITANSLSSLNTAIESNLFDLDIKANHITLRTRPISNTEVDEAVKEIEANEKTTYTAGAVRSGSAGELMYMREAYAKEATTPRGEDSGGNWSGHTESEKTFKETTKARVAGISSAAEQGNLQTAASEMVGLLGDMIDVTNTYGIWVKGPGARIVDNHVLVPPELNRKQQARGGILMESGEEVTRLDAVAALQSQSPLLGITETVVASNEIIGGVGAGIDIREIFLAGQVYNRAAGDPARHAENQSASRRHPVNVRANEISDMVEGGIVMGPASGVKDLEIVENTVSACGGGSSESYGWWAHEGIHVVDITRGRLHGNRVVDSPGGALAVYVDAVDQLIFTDNTVRGLGRFISQPGTTMAREVAESHVFMVYYLLTDVSAQSRATVNANMFDSSQPNRVPMRLDVSNGHTIVTSNIHTGNNAIITIGTNVQAGFNYPTV
ncbi:MAG: hypothetical protein GVY14_02005 [Spirochaetes bacterium]|nr:hypothetical protein [Spirochaetota bacterium]